MRIGIDQRGKHQYGPDNPCWKGGRSLSSKGYVIIRIPKHPRASINGYVFEHIVVLETKLGRSLLDTECCHHINGIITDNRPENLVVMDHALHTAKHWIGKHHTQESRDKISKAKTGKKQGETFRNKQKDLILKRIRDEKGRLLPCV